MEAMELYDLVESDDRFEGVSISPNAVVVRHCPTGIKTSVPIDTLGPMDRDVVISILAAEREPEGLYHMTRVIGYFSRTQNFNSGKIGELRDRVQGNYGFDGKGSSKECLDERLSVVESLS